MSWFIIGWFGGVAGVELVGRWITWRRLDPRLYRCGAVSILVLNRTRFWELHRLMRADFEVGIRGEHVRTRYAVTADELREALRTTRHLSKWVP